MVSSTLEPSASFVTFMLQICFSIYIYIYIYIIIIIKILISPRRAFQILITIGIIIQSKRHKVSYNDN